MLLNRWPFNVQFVNGPTTSTAIQSLLAGSQAFEADQQPEWEISYWDTPFSVLEGDVASGGIPFWLREPTTAGVFSTAALKAATTQAGCDSAFTGLGREIVTNGRLPNLVGYWAGGAPGHHGAAFARRVCYRFKAYLRSVAGRSWFDAAPTPTWTPAFAGNGYLKVFKVVSGTPTLLYDGTLLEQEFLEGGFKLTATITNMAAGDYLDIFYIQDNEGWGGFVLKAIQGTLPSTLAAKQAAARTAPIIGCGLLDDNAPPPKRTIKMFRSGSVDSQIGASARATFELPLITDTNDGLGWQWIRSGSNDPGVLRAIEPLATPFDIKRQRLVTIRAGFGAIERYSVFTGFIDDWGEPSGGVVPVKCLGFEQRLLDQYNKNYPDKISYMAFGYRNRTGTAEPVYEIAAYDNWPIEHAVRDLFARAGLDESKVFKNLAVPKADGSSEVVVYGTDTFRKFRARSLSGALLRLERPVHYGNAGAAFNELQAPDDEYIFRPENTKELWNRCRELSDRYGYDMRFDEFGDAWLQARNNPHSVTELTAFGKATGGSTTTLTDTTASFKTALIGQILTLTSGTGSGQSSTITAVTATQLTVSPPFGTAPVSGTGYRSGKTSPSAYGGSYGEYTGTVSLFTTTMKGARIDLSVPRSSGHGNWTYSVKRTSDAAVVASGTLNPSTSGADEFFYDFRSAVDGGNSTVVTLFSGAYDSYSVDLSSSGGAGGTVRRLDCFLIYHTDPTNPRLPQALSTAINALEVQSHPMMDDMRNYVLVVGRRRAVVTDSAKLDTNPNNPDGEFIVERAVDVGSIVNPAATNFIGFPKESIIYDSGITDQDFAAYLARVFIYRQRMPLPNAAIQHTLLPGLNLRDPVFAVEEGFQTIDAQTVLYVTGIRHSFEFGRATTSIETTSSPEFPAFEPREDMDIDANFGGYPVVNIKVDYPSVTGEIKTNMPVGTTSVPPYVLSTPADLVKYTGVTVQAGPPKFLDLSGGSFSWPPIPGTVQVRPAAGTLAGSQQTVYVPAPATRMIARSGGGIGISPGNRIQLPNLKTLDAVVLEATEGTFIASPTKGAAEWHYEYDELTETIALFYDQPVTNYNTDSGVTTEVFQWTARITYTPYADGIRAGYAGNNPYHHLLNVDYRNSNRRIYLPWVEGDSSAPYNGLAAITSLDVRYRRLGAVDGSGNFSDPYSGLSPFFDPYTSELGYLVNVSFDALISGLYRVSVRSRVDDTVVAWLTEPGADPDDKETHWQYMSAGVGKSFSWDGVDQVGTWNRRQSEDYATGAMGAFEQDQRPVIGKGFYVWNEERRSGAFGAQALIAGTRDATTGVPAFGVGTFATWYVKFEAKNDTLEAIAQTNLAAGGVRDPKKVSPRVLDSTGLDPTFNAACVRDTGTSTGSNTSTILNDTGKAWTVNQWKGYHVKITSGVGVGQTRTIASNTATQLTILSTEPWATTPTTSGYQVLSMAAVVYTHLPEPTKVEVSVADWKATVAAFDETNQSAIDTGSNWSTSPDETGMSTGSNTSSTLNDTGKAWTVNQWKGREVKLTGGTGAGQLRRVVSNTATQLTVTPTWSPTPDGTSVYRILSGALVNNQKPVRVRFTVANRPGTLWTGKQNEVSVRLTRRVHLRASVFDQFAIYSGVNYPGQVREKRRVATRRLMNDSHTIDFADDAYRKASSFKQTDGGAGLEWLFLPRHFAKDFRGIANEVLQFGDYLQLEEVPSWDPNRAPASERSRLLLAFMNYLFYLSAFTQDRSGRMVWCLNRKFLDKTKVIKNAYGDWWDPANPTTPANSTTYRNAWPDSYLRQHRRTLVVRQWADESGWQAGQLSKYGFSAGSTADKLLRHLWKDHDVETNTLLVDATWPVLDTDEYSKWHRDSSRTQLPSTFFNMTRQLGATGSTRLTGTIANWTWEGQGDSTQWVPCVTRDFHGYHFVPPMVDKNNTEGGLTAKSNIYRSVDPNGYRSGDNTGDDTAAAEVWNSPVWDVTQSYVSGSTGKKRFNPGIIVDPGNGPTANPLDANVFDCQRQDDLVHYEDIRGMFSRGARPQEQPKKVSPGMPYFINPYAYTTIDTARAYKNDKYPKHKALVSNWFDMKFRYEYLWESAELFPTDDVGREILGLVNYDVLRLETSADKAIDVRFDGGAWTGWKDDKFTTSEADANYKLHTNRTNVFLPGSGTPPAMPIAAGPQLEVTTDMVFHLVLVNERRSSPLNV